MVLQSGRQKKHGITPALLLKAYGCGLFPMAESADDPNIFWVEPKTRGIIPLDALHVPRSLARTIRRGKFEIRINSAFRTVIERCAEMADNRPSTWINTTIRDLYVTLHGMGHAHCVEAWHEGELVGGLYGVSLGGAFFGESMFTRKRDASKVCLVHLVNRLNKSGYVLLDTQFTTDHLKRFGAIDVAARRYDVLLEEALSVEPLPFA